MDNWGKIQEISKKNACRNLYSSGAQVPERVKSSTETLNSMHTILRRSEYFIVLTAIVFNKNNFRINPPKI
jgi:hypothetical protein